MCVKLTFLISSSQAVESIRAVVALCDSADEELRHIAMQSLLTFGMSTLAVAFLSTFEYESELFSVK